METEEFTCECCGLPVNDFDFLILSSDDNYYLSDETFIIHKDCNKNMKRHYDKFVVLKSCGDLNLIKVHEEID